MLVMLQVKYQEDWEWILKQEHIFQIQIKIKQ